MLKGLYKEECDDAHFCPNNTHFCQTVVQLNLWLFIYLTRNQGFCYKKSQNNYLFLKNDLKSV